MEGITSDCQEEAVSVSGVTAKTTRRDAATPDSITH